MPGRGTLNWGIVGTGAIGEALARALAALPGQRLAAVCSRDADRARAFAAAHGEGDCLATGDLEALLAEPAIDAVYVATPHPGHLQPTLSALAAGKAVLCEKPLGINHAEVMAMTDAAARRGRLLMEAFMYRCHPQTRRLCALLADGAIGELRHIEASFGFSAPFDAESRLFANDLAGGGILDVGCYPLSMARLLTGLEPERIEAHGHLGATGVDHWSAALLAFAGGVTAQIATGVAVTLSNHVELFGSRGRIRVDRPWHPGDAGGHWSFTLRRGDAEPEIVAGRADPLYELEVLEFARCLATGETESPAMDWADSLGNARALDAWRRAVDLEYEQETPPRLGRRPWPGVAPAAAEAVLPQRPVPPFGKAVGALVMGCDNQPDLPHASLTWDYFFARGGNVFDTAWLYGEGAMERLLGHWHRARGLREEMVIIGKGGHTPLCFPQAIAPQLDESLERLQTNYLDLYCLHRDNPEVPAGEFIDALNGELARGRVRAIGASNWSLARLMEANDYARSRGLRPLQGVSNQLSLARMAEPIWPGVESARAREFRAWLSRESVLLLPWSSQARGFFTSWADAVRNQSAASRAAATRMEPSAAELERTWFAEDNFERRARAEVLAERYGVPMIQVALAWVLAQPFPCLPLIGPRSLAEIRSCIAAAGVPLTAAECAWLEGGGEEPG